MVSVSDSVVVTDKLLRGNWEGIWKEAVWPAWRHILELFWLDWRTQPKSSARIASAPAEFRTYSLPNTRQNFFVSTSGFEYEKSKEGQFF
jgi:hypothetical protein